MTTVLNQLHKDVRGHSLWLAAWALLCVLPLTVLAVPADAFMTRVAVNTIAPVLRFVLFVVLIALAVHEDPLVSSTAFWLTRPVSAWALLTSKLCFVGGLLVLPVVVADTILVASTGVGTPYVFLAIPEIALQWIMTAACVLALAALTSTLPGFLGATFKVALLAIPTYFLVQRAFPVVHGARITTFVDLWHEAPSLLASRALVTSAFLTVAALAVATIQYRTRRTGLAWTTVGVALLCVGSLRAAWRWDLFTRPESPPRGNMAIGQNVELSVVPAANAESLAMEYEGTAVNRKSVYGRVLVQGVELPLAAEIEDLQGWMTFDDGSRLPLTGRNWEPMGSRWNPAALEALLEGAHFVNLQQEGALLTPLLSAEASDYDRHAGTPARLGGTVVLALRTYRVAAELPVRVRAAYDHGVEQAVIIGVQSRGGDCTVSVRETQVSLLLAPNVSLHRSMLFFRFNPDVLYVLRNRQRNEAFWPVRGMNFGFGWPARTRIDEITTVQTYRSIAGGGPPLPRIDDAWIAGADLVRVEAERQGTITRPIAAESFVFSDG